MLSNIQFKAAKRLELRHDLGPAVVNAKNKKSPLEGVRLRRVVQQPDASDTDDIPAIKENVNKPRTWMVDAEWLSRHPRARARMHNEGAAGGAA